MASATKKTLWRFIDLKRGGEGNYVSNRVQTSHYSWLTLVPRNIFEQFKRVANIWFLCVAVFQLVAIENTTNTNWTTISPLLLLLLLKLVKDGYHDFHRHQTDSLMNQRRYEVWGKDAFKEVACEDIRVGNYVLLRDGMMAPADLLVVATSSQDHACYIDTSRNHGDVNLKVKKAVKETVQRVSSLQLEKAARQLKRLQGVVRLGEPCQDYDVLEATIKLPRSPKAIPISTEHFILRGSIIRVASWVLCLVVYTGTETKMFLNSSSPRPKQSAMERRVNRWVAFILAALLLLVLCFALCSMFVSDTESSSTDFPRRFIVFGLLFNNIIPISLFVSMDLIRVGQTFFMKKDSAFSGEVRFNTSDINEDLGEVEYVFLEQTALVDSTPVVEVLIIGEDEYLRDLNPEAEVPYPSKNSPDHYRAEEYLPSTEAHQQLLTDEARTYLTSEQMLEPRSFDALRTAAMEGEDASLDCFFQCLALCTDFVPNDENLFISASREDEVVMQTIREIGCELEQRSANHCELNFFGRVCTFEIVASWESTPDTERTRVIVQRPGEDIGVFFVKGPLSVMGNILGVSSNEFKRIEKTVASMASQGLAHTIAGCCELSAEKMAQIKKKFAAAQLAVADVSVKMNRVFEDLEEEEIVRFLGIVGLSLHTPEDAKDMLQIFSEAGIKVWLVNSGSEAANLQAGFDAGLIKRDETLIQLKGFQSEDVLQKELVRYIQYCIGSNERRQVTFNSTLSDVPLLQGNSRHKRVPGRRRASHRVHAQAETVSDLSYNPTSLSYSVSIDNVTFDLALQSMECRRLLAYLLFCASSVLCSSLVPGQKRTLVNFVKNSYSFRPVTLALASDSSGIAMMQAADVSIALRDRNKLAESVSDVTISRVGQLRPLLLKHGQWHSSRMSRVILLFLYKNILLVTVLVWYTLVDDFTGTLLLDSGLTACFNVLFTSLPIIYIGVFDQHLTFPEIEAVPSAYSQDLIAKRLHWRLLLKYIFNAVVQALLLVALLYPAVLPVLDGGHTETFLTTGTLFFITIVLAVNVQIAIDTHCYTVGFLNTNVLSLGLLFLYIGIAASFPNFELYDVLRAIFSSSTHILSIFMGTLACFVVGYTLSTYKTLFSPTIIDKFRSRKVASVDYVKSFFSSRVSLFRNHLKEVYRNAFVPDKPLDSDPYCISPISLRFASPYIEARYQSKFIKTNVKVLRTLLLLVWLGSLAWIGVDAGTEAISSEYIIYRVIISAAFLACFGVTLLRGFSAYYRVAVLSLIFVGLMAKLAAELMYEEVGGMVAAMVPLISYILLNVDFQLVTALNVLNIVLFTITGAYIQARKAEPTEGALRMLCYEVALIAQLVIAGRAGYVLEKASRMEHQVKSNTKREIEKSSNILSLLLPSFVISQVKHREAGKYIAEDQGDVTIIFCDIYDFDTICSLYKPQELTAFLDEVFQQFDGLCQLNGVVKIETVGKTYMACSGLKYVDADLPSELRSISHPRRAAEFAFDLLTTAKNYKIKNGKPLQLKIGINSGPVISGVVGYHKPQFSLVGDTVNTASRMCSTIEKVNMIQITQKTKDMMVDQNGIVFETKTVYAKGKGDMKAYLITEGELEAQHTSDLSTPKQIARKRTTFLDMFSKNERGMDEETGEESRGFALQIKWNPFWPLISFHETEEEALFRQEAIRQTRSVRKWSLATASALQLFLFALRVAQYCEVPEMASSEVLVAYGLLAMVPLGYLALPSSFFESRFYIIVQIPAFLAVDVLTLFDLIYGTEYDSELVAIGLMQLFLINSWSGLSFFRSASLLAVLVGASWLIMIQYVGNWWYHLVLFAFIAIYLCINNYALYKREKQLRLYSQLKQLENKEVKNNEKLLEQMMPKSVYEKLKQDLPVTDKLRNMSILFADIVGFTNWSSDKLPEEVVGMLSALFTEFDLLCVRFKIYKVHTIGDCYVVMGFDGSSETFDPSIGCLRVLCMAHEMIRSIREVNEREGINLNMRIGIHTGEVIAGITGKDVIRYDIYGSAVMVANKMESGGSAGKVNVSEVTREVLERLVPDILEYSDNQEIEAKGINKKYMSYFVHVKDHERLLSIANEG